MTGSMDETMSGRYGQAIWWTLGGVFTAHVDGLLREGIIDGDAHIDVVNTIASVGPATPPAGSLLQWAREFEDRVDALCPPRVKGVVRTGRGTPETIQTVARLLVRRHLVVVGLEAESMMEALLSMAGAHVATMLPAYARSEPVQPTTLAHFLGGTTGSLSRASDGLRHATEVVNQSPMGSVAMASSRFAPERRKIAAALEFDGIVVNTFDAVAAVDYLAISARSIGTVAMSIDRLLRAIEEWIRAVPEAFVVSDEHVGRLSDVPQFRLPALFAPLRDAVAEITMRVDGIEAWTRRAEYGPQLHFDLPLMALVEAGERCVEALDIARTLLTEAITVNRAVLGNKAGKAFLTMSDLVDFLILEEQIAPGDAQIIAARVLGMVRDQGIEIAAITREIVDAAGLLVIGREIGIEFEAPSRYLAPRRFIESRNAEGGPAPAEMRRWIAEEQRRAASRRAAWEADHVRFGRVDSRALPDDDPTLAR
ncbi:hypothetical protein BH23CHL5_BH23CHL5_23260 [soil metagenome]